MLTAILALNVTCGIAFISQAVDAAQDIAGVGAGTASGFVGAMGLFNGAGRIFWAALSDKVGRMVEEANGTSYGTPFTVIVVIAAASILLPLVTRMPRPAREGPDVGIASVRTAERGR